LTAHCLAGLPDGMFFKPKVPIWVNFGGSCDGKYWYILWLLGIFCGHLPNFVAICHILWLFGMNFPVLVCCTTKNLATLLPSYASTFSE
jgi:hypothetical protein